MKKITLFLSCILILCIFSCEKDDNTVAPIISEEEPIIPINFEENFGTTITARFLGRVVNEQNEPIQGATIQIGNSVTSTDLFGIFSMSDAAAYEKFAYVTATKDGYIIGSRALVPSASEVNRVEIMLLKEDVIATINSGQQATVNLSNGTEVTFDGNFTKEDGSAYSGEVKVILKHLSPDDENMDAMMPGMLFAQDASGDAVALETYGMLVVELRSNSGEELQLATGSSSQISMPLAANTLNPPATIPLWHFDETLGYWIEEGEATLQGNKYVGDVAHFSFWNYDFPYPSIVLCIQLEDENGNPMPYTALDLHSTLLNSTGTYGYTNSNGVECGLVPSGEEFTVIVPGVSCANQPFTTTIGPFTSDTNITIPVIATNQNTTTLTGTFITCDGNNVTNGYMQLFINGTSEIIPVTDGTINYAVSYCGTLDYSIKGIDVTNNQVTSVTTGTLNGSATVDLGVLSSCTGFVDTDGDGIFDSFEDLNGDNDLTNDDTDNDGIPNYQDADDDGDGINTADEDYDGDNDPTNDDTDGDQIPNYLDNQDVVVYSTDVAGEGCDPITYNLDDIITNHYSGQGTANMTYVFYENEADAIAETNPITTSIYQVSLADLVNNGAVIHIKGTSTITGQSDIAYVYLFYGFPDTDNDGLTDCEETTGVDDPNTPLVPTGITNPNDACDPIETSSLIDSDNDGLTDCEETTGTDNIHTPLIPAGTSDPNDSSDPNQAPTLQIAGSGVVIYEGDGLNEWAILSLSHASTEAISVNVQTVDGTATAPLDYSAVNVTVTIPAGDVSMNLANLIPIINDTEVEGTENFFLQATVISGNTTNASALVELEIIDDDVAPSITDFPACRNPTTGTATFDIQSMIPNFVSLSDLQSGLLVFNYYYTEQDARAFSNSGTVQGPLITSQNTMIYAAVWNPHITPSADAAVSILNCIINETPTAVGGLSLTTCDGNSDGFATFDLSQLNTQILQTQPSANFNITYHETPEDAVNNVNPIQAIYTNIITNQQTIYYRIEDFQTGCFNTGAIDLIVDSGC
ncbi:hypothetical protein IMCC3317_17480 [Kordia antarctica]|uniref:Calx-beta domain-containing protein n=1 Tax=Kordia antarctica TaxID=1218801 RepID=A0A7L4ZJK7_9FLAO|nr:Calx-beta domain-containing protein [Kordia antarctica]QHI36386.1 hypothetical protein IMCC3317_17480 [Kordia antarctica]